MIHIVRLCLGTAVIVVSAMNAAAGLRVTASTDQRMTMDWTMESFEANEGPGGIWLSTPDANTELREPGTSAAPVHVFHVGVPPLGWARVTVVPLEVTTRVLTRPLATIALDTSHARRAPVPRFLQAWMSAGERVTVGPLRAMYYVLNPFRYDDRTRTLSVLKRARVEVTIDRGAPAATTTVGTTGFTPVLKKTILNYDRARAWAPAPPTRSMRKAQARSALDPRLPLATFRIGDGTSGLNEGLTEENGLVRLTGSAIGSALGQNLEIHRIALYAAVKGELSRTVPDVAAGVEPSIVEIPVLRFDLNGDGRMGTEDYLVAWVTGASDWRYNAGLGDHQFVLNRYTDYRTYWLAYRPDSAATMRTHTQPAAASTVTTSVAGRTYLKRSRLMPEDGREGTIDWVWERLTTNAPSMSVDVPMQTVDTSVAGSLTVMRGAARGGLFDLAVGGQSVCQSCVAQQSYPIDRWGNGRIDLVFQGTGTDAYMEPEHMELRYTQKLDMTGRTRLTALGQTAGSGTVTYRVSGLPASQRVFIVRASDNDSGTTLVDTVRTGGAVSWSDSAKSPVRYHVVTETAMLQPTLTPYTAGSATSTRVVDLRTGAACDYLVIYHADFASAAQRLVDHKRGTGLFPQARMVDISDVYREFSGGQIDPTALRNFIWHAKHNWPSSEALTYVVVVGMGNYDYKGVSHAEPIFIPVSEEGSLGSQVCNEDYFYGDSSDIVFGRIPSLTLAQAQALVDKVIEMEDPAVADYGAWRNRMVLVADNDRQGPAPDRIGHHISSEKVAEVVSAVSPATDFRKAYLFEYEFNDDWDMPSAAQSLMSEINAGAAVVNYFGHGGENVWADERVLTMDDLNRMSNRGRYAFFSSLSCRVGLFDRPGDASMSDALITLAGAGGIGSIASTREAWASNNEPLGIAMFRAIYDSIAPLSYGAAYTYGRFMNRDKNLDAYCFLGDPSVGLRVPQRRLAMQVVDVEGSPLDTIRALQQVVVRGQVLAGSTVDGSFGSASRPAALQLALYNPQDTGRRKDGLTDVVFYMVPGSPVFAGVAQVVGGRFEQKVLVPRNVVFDKPGVRLLGYAWFDTLVAAMSDESRVFHGTDTSAAARTDTRGPVIAVRPVSASSSAGRASYEESVRTMLPCKLEVVVCDENGVDVVGTGPDEGMTVEIPGVMAKRTVNQLFRFRDGDYREGTVPLVIDKEDAVPGTYELLVTARDLLENMTSARISIEILAAEKVSLDHAYNYPNPVRMGSSVRFYYNNPGTVQTPASPVVLKIYSLSGRLLRTVRNLDNGWEWDLTDQFGRSLSPNTYLWQMTLSGVERSDKPIRGPIRKLVVHPPR